MLEDLKEEEEDEGTFLTGGLKHIFLQIHRA